jgi:hypothetical protein
LTGRALLLCLAQLLLVTPALLAQDQRLADRLEPGTQIAVQRLLDSARTLQLPTEPLVLKALEGASKGADSVRIVAAVRALTGHLSAARQALGPRASEAELVAAAAALRAGASRERLAELNTAGTRELTVPLSVLADLLTTGVPVDEAWRNVSSMVSHGAPDAAFLELRNRLSQGRPRLPPPAERAPAAPLPGTERTP